MTFYNKHNVKVSVQPERKVPETPRPRHVVSSLTDDIGTDGEYVKVLEGANRFAAAQPGRNMVRSSGKRRRPVRKGRKGRSKLALPPTLECSPVHGTWFRFDATGSLTAQPVSFRNLLAVCGCVGTVVNTTGTTIASAVRLRKIRMWPAAGGEANIQWSSSTTHTRDEAKDITLPTGITVDRMVELTPPPGSFAEMWFGAADTNTTVMTVTATVGAIIDVLLDFTLANSIAGLSTTFATIGLGSQVYGYLDGNTSHLIKPLGRNTTF